MYQLQNIVVEVLLKLSPGYFDAIFKSAWRILLHFNNLSYRFLLGLLLKGNFFGQCIFDLVEVLGFQSEFVTKNILGPLDAVKSFLGEHLQSAVRDFIILLRVTLRCI